MNISESKQVFEPAVAPLRNARAIERLVAIAAALAVTAGLFLHAGGWFTPHALTPAKIIDTFEQVNGVHPGFRRNHAKGVDVTGFFESNGRGQSLSKAQVFRPGRTPIVGRFALAGGQPYAGDTSETTRSLAIRFQQANGEEWRTAMINIPVFVVNTPQAFAEFLVASAADPNTGKPNPAAMGAFLGHHLETAAALAEIGRQRPSSGFADSPYWALNAFRFVNARGESTPVRWYVAPDQNLGTEASSGKNYLFDALIAQIHAKPLRWRLMLIVGQPGDPTADATRPWPSYRQQIDAGTLTFTTIESDDTGPARDINYDPLVLPSGIGPSDDRLLSARSAAYSQSFTRRERERKSPGAVSPAEVEK